MHRGSASERCWRGAMAGLAAAAGSTQRAALLRARSDLALPGSEDGGGADILSAGISSAAVSARAPGECAGSATGPRQTIGALSKGYRRRFLLALGLLAPRPVLLMDEPFDGFDLRQTREVMNLLRSEAVDGRTLVLSIHQLADAQRICDRLVLLSAGLVKGVGTLAELTVAARLPIGSNLEEVFLALA